MSCGTNVGAATPTSSNITWSNVGPFYTHGNTQYFNYAVGVVHTAFSAASEVVTATWPTACTHRTLWTAAYEPLSGYEFASSPAQQSNYTTYVGGTNPQTVDGYSASVTTTGANKFLIVCVLTVEDVTGDNPPGSAAAGTGFTEDYENYWETAGTFGAINIGSKEQSAAGTIAGTATYSQNSTYGSDLFVVALELIASQSGPSSRIARIARMIGVAG
jgi:hypothetical protein